MAKKLKVGDVVVARRSDKILGIKAGNIGELVGVTQRYIGSPNEYTEVHVDFPHSEHEAVVMTSKEVTFLARRPESGVSRVPVSVLSLGDTVVDAGVEFDITSLVDLRDGYTAIVADGYAAIVESDDEIEVANYA